MHTVPLKLVTIVAEPVLEERIAEALHRLGIGDARPGIGQQALVRVELSDQRREQSLCKLHHIFPLDE